MRFRPLIALAFVVPLATSSAQVDNPDYRTLVNDISGIEDINTRPFLASALASEAAFTRGDRCAALGAIGALWNKLVARLVDNPDYVDNPDFRALLGDVVGIIAVLQAPDGPDLLPRCVDNPDI